MVPGMNVSLVMKYFSLVGICLFMLFPSYGQSFFKHYPIQKVKNGREDQLLITSNSDLAEIQANVAVFSHVNSVCLDGEVDVNKAIEVLYNLVEVYEIKLRNYSGSIRDFSGDTLDLYEDIIYYITYENEMDLKTLDRFPKLNSLTIVHPGPVVEDYYLLLHLKNTTKLNILGDFFVKDMDSIAHYVGQLKQLKELGLGLDYITDLKKELFLLPNLKVLTVFDNASHVNNIEFIDYPMDKRFVQIPLGKTKKNVELRFFSDRSNIELYDIFYVKEYFEKATFSKTSWAKETKSEKGAATNWSVFTKDTTPLIDYASHTHAATDAPIPHLTPTVEYYKIDPTKNNIVHTKSGVELKIIANSITDQFGFVVKEETIIAFANLVDPINGFLAGLKMESFRKGQEIQLNPLSMFEIKAFVKGEPALLKKGYAIKATFVLPRDTQFSQYILDPQSRKWRPMTGYYYTKKLGEIQHQSFNNWNELESTRDVYLFDNKTFDERYKSPEYFYLMELEYGKRNFEKRKGLKFNSYTTNYYFSENKTSLSVKEGRKLVKILKQPRVEGDAKSLIRFKLIDAYDFELFKELKAFKKYEFKSNFELGRREFSKFYTLKKRYFDLRVLYKYQENKGFIEFKDENGYKVLEFFVSEEEKESFWKLYQKYTLAKDLHSKEYNEVVAEKEKKFIANYNRNRIKEGEKEYSAILTGFGIYSNANEAVMQNKKEIIANFTDLQGIPIDLKKCYILHKNTNTIYTYTDGNITFDKNNISAIVCLDHKGKVYFIDGDRLSSLHLEDYSYSVIKLEWIEFPIKTSEEFKEFIGIE